MRRCGHGTGDEARHPLAHHRGDGAIGHFGLEEGQPFGEAVGRPQGGGPVLLGQRLLGRRGCGVEALPVRRHPVGDGLGVSELPRTSATIGPRFDSPNLPYSGAVAAKSLRRAVSRSVSSTQYVGGEIPLAIAEAVAGRLRSRRRPRRERGVVDKVRLGVLGAGNIAATHIKGYLLDPRCEIAAVCDTDEDIGRRAAVEWGAPAFYTDLDAMLNDPSLDAVEVLTPTYLHHDHVIAALEAGKHVSVQKPAATTIEDAPGDGRRRRTGRPDAANQRVHHPLPADRTGQEARDRRRHREAAGLRIRTVVGQTDSAFQANLRPEGYSWRLDARHRAAICSTTWCTSTPWRCGCSTWTSPRCRRWSAGGTCSSSRVSPSSSSRIPMVLGTMEVQYAPGL